MKLFTLVCVFITVWRSTVAIAITLTPELGELGPGEDIILTCSSADTEVVAMGWYYEGENITQFSRTDLIGFSRTVILSGFTFTLQLVSVMPEFNSTLSITADADMNGHNLSCVVSNDTYELQEVGQTLFVTRYTIVNCSTPSAGDGVIINPYSNTTEGASISFTCGPGQEEIIAICYNNGSWIPNPADIVCTNPPESIDIINCSTPSAGDGVIINPYSNTTDGASISFTCGLGQEEIIAICSRNGSWTPNPADRVCTTNPPESAVSIPGVVFGVLGAVLLIAMIIVVTLILCYLFLFKKRKKVTNIRDMRASSTTAEEEKESALSLSPRYATINTLKPSNLVKVNSQLVSKYIDQKSSFIIPGRYIELAATIGSGEFGVVYHGYLTGWKDMQKHLVAVKTLRSYFSEKDVDDLLKESETMTQFDHPNVMSLIGVSIDVGKAPYIVMPYMANGSLLSYLRKERPNLNVTSDAGEELIMDTQRKLLAMCFQIAKGMSYLTEKKFVHRDLATRNCMMDQDFVIKVADFGLSEDVYMRNYFKQTQDVDEPPVKLPIKWMAMESLMDAIFNEKTDVWSFGVTCWEVFSLGRTPYSLTDPISLIDLLENGGRLKKPSNAACTPEVYEFIVKCWIAEPSERPSFSDMVKIIESQLNEMTDYLDLASINFTV